MITKQLLSDLKSKLMEATQMVNDLTNSDTLQTYTLSDGTHITYLTAIVRSYIQRGWQLIPGTKLTSGQILNVKIEDGNMIIEFTLGLSRSIETIPCITFPPKFAGQSQGFTIKKVDSDKVLKELTHLDETNRRTISVI